MAKKKSSGSRMSKPKVITKIRLIESEEAGPQITAEPGTRIELVAVELVSGDVKKPMKMASRLCGGTSTCVALVRTEES